MAKGNLRDTGLIWPVILAYNPSWQGTWGKKLKRWVTHERAESTSVCTLHTRLISFNLKTQRTVAWDGPSLLTLFKTVKPGRHRHGHRPAWSRQPATEPLLPGDSRLNPRHLESRLTNVLIKRRGTFLVTLWDVTSELPKVDYMEGWQLEEESLKEELSSLSLSLDKSVWKCLG